MASATGRSERAKRRTELRGDVDFQIPEKPKRKRIRYQFPVKEPEILEVLTPEELETRTELISSVLNNELLWNHIVMQLDVLDMKKLNTLNHQFFEKVKESKYFQNISLVPVALSKFAKELLPKHNLELVWKNVELDITDLPSSLQLKKLTPTLKRRLRDTKFLYIYAKKFEYFENQTKTYIPIFKTILSSTPNLESLTLVSTMMKMDWTGVLNDGSVRACFKQLKELHLILGFGIEHVGDDHYVSENFRQLAKIPLKLRSFTWGRLTIGVDEDLERNIDLDLSPVIDIIRSSQDSLISLSLHGRIIRTDGFEQIRCPALRTLKVNSTITDVEDSDDDGVPKTLRKFYDFLENLENLEDLDISMEVHGDDILEILQAKSKQWRLKRLRIDLGVEANFFPGIYWNSIRSIEIQGGTDWNEMESKELYYREVLPILPSHLYTLNLRDLDCDQDDDTTATLSAFMRIELERFSCLTELSLLNRENERVTPVDDDLLQFIFSHLTKLRVFRLANCPSITNYGFSGSRNNNVSILNLKKLRHLVIVNCPLVKDRFGLIGGLQFPELSFILFLRDENTIRGRRTFEVSLGAWKDIARNNPKLTTIVLHNSKNLRIARELKGINPSIRRVYNNYFDTDTIKEEQNFDTPSTMVYEDLQYVSCSGFEGDRYGSDSEELRMSK